MQWIPIINFAIDLFGSAPYAPTAGGMIYDVLQVFAALKIIGGAGAWLAKQTDWDKDDKFWPKWLYWMGKATSFITDLASGNSRPPEKR